VKHISMNRSIAVPTPVPAHRLDHHHGAVRCGRPTAPGQDPAGVVVVPVVRDVAQQIGVGSYG
jgi:hypothetical protein